MMEKEEKEEVTHPALLNSCVLRELSRFLDTDSLKTARLVCNTWNSCMGPMLQNRTVVNIRFCEEIIAFNSVLSSALVNSNTHRLVNLRIRLFEHELSHASFITLLSDHRDSLKYLDITASGSSRYAYNPPDTNVFVDALTALPHLEHLTISDVPTNLLVGQAFEGKKFARLKSCALSPNRSEKESAEEHHFVICCIRACEQTLRRLHLWRFNSQPFYNELFSYVNLVGLTELRFGLEGPEQVPRPILKDLPRFVPHLERLSISSAFGDFMETFLFSLARLNNLVSLQLKGRNRLFEHQLRDLPVMPNLKEFSSRRMVLRMEHADLTEKLPALKKLEVDEWAVTTYDCKNAHHVEEIALRSRHLVEAMLLDLMPTFYMYITHEHFPKLTKLTTGLQVKQASIIFANLPNLKELTILKESQIGDEDITGIAEKDLNALRPTDLERQTAYIGDLQELQVLKILGSRITSKSLKYGICDLHNLTNLTLHEPSGVAIVNNEYYGDYADMGLFIIRDNASFMFDIQYLMLPNVPYLVQLNTVSTSGSCLVDYIQVNAMKASRGNFHHRSTVTGDEELPDL